MRLQYDFVMKNRIHKLSQPRWVYRLLPNEYEKKKTKKKKQQNWS